MGQAEVYELLKEVDFISRKDIEEHFEIPVAHADRLYNCVKKYKDVKELEKIVTRRIRGNSDRRFVVQFITLIK